VVAVDERQVEAPPRGEQARILTEFRRFLELPLRYARDARQVSERTPTMTTILILNAASSLLAVAGIGGYLALAQRRARRRAAVQVLYVTRARTSGLPYR
jgi:hypothetical protein